MNKEQSSKLIFGCMGLGGEWNQSSISRDDISQANLAIDTALEGGITVFDHADIYTLGKAETVFGLVLKKRRGLRETITLQSKCGIRFDDSLGPKRYDFSHEWLTQSVEGSLSRLQVDRLNTLMLHRPDPLMEVDEVCRSLQMLYEQGKVEQFGVSNMHWYQIDYLQKNLSVPIVANQLELSLANRGWLEEGLLAGTSDGKNMSASVGTVEFCQQNNIQIQAWGSLAQGVYSGRPVSNESAVIQDTAVLVAQLSEKYQTSREAIVLAWLMRHPADIRPVIGTANSKRIKACCEATSVTLTREDWYDLFVTARGVELP